MVVPHAATFAGLYNVVSRTYSRFFDEAMRDSRENARRMRNDPVIRACMRQRATALSLVTYHLEPEDEDDASQNKAATMSESLFKTIPGLTRLRRWNFYEGDFVGRSAAQVRYQKVYKPKYGRTFEIPTKWWPVAGDKLVFKWDGTVGFRVSGMFKGPIDYTSEGTVYWLTPQDREQLILYQFEPEDNDYFMPLAAGSINGLGLRDALYWLWALKSRIWSLGIDFLEWFARGILIYYFESGNQSHLDDIVRYLEMFEGSSVRLVPYTSDKGPSKPVERIEANGSNTQFIQQLVMNYFDDLIRYIIIGQTATQKAVSTGLGSHVAEAHENTFEQIIKYGCDIGDEVMSENLVTPFYSANFPGMPPARWKSNVDNPNVQQLMDAAETIYGMGGAVPEDPLLEASGLPEPKDGDTLLTNVQPMQPAAVDNVPENVPIVDGQPAAPPPERQSSTPVRMSAKNWNMLVRAGKTNSRAAKLCRRLAPNIVIH